jgi:Recombination endonuclease VII
MTRQRGREKGMPRSKDGISKRCPRCQQDKPVAEFPLDPSRADGLYPYCCDCKASYMRTYARSKPGYHRRIDVLRRYGLTWSAYQELLKKQDGKCAICGTGVTVGQNLAVDHDHKTGEVRGLLCSPCNLGLGAFADDPQRLRKAADYLEGEGKAGNVSQR